MTICDESFGKLSHENLNHFKLIGSDGRKWVGGAEVGKAWDEGKGLMKRWRRGRRRGKRWSMRRLEGKQGGGKGRGE